jgi:hypothetical protein
MNARTEAILWLYKSQRRPRTSGGENQRNTKRERIDREYQRKTNKKKQRTTQRKTESTNGNREIKEDRLKKEKGGESKKPAFPALPSSPERKQSEQGKTEKLQVLISLGIRLQLHHSEPSETERIKLEERREG